MVKRTAADTLFFRSPKAPPPKQARSFPSPRSLITSLEIPYELTNPQRLTQKLIKERHTQHVDKRSKLANSQVDHLSAEIPPVIRASTSIQAQKDTPPLNEDFSGGNTFFLSVIFGEHEQFGLSKIGRADKEIQMWEIVDKASHYNEFTKDRSSRLDRYFEVYGPGWLFYESPLKAHPSIKPKMGGSVALKSSNTFSAMGGYYVTQGFWKQANYVSRMPPRILGAAGRVPEDPHFARDSAGRVDCGLAGPKLAFKSVLDSGATYPTLHQEDLRNLGVDPVWYAAQTVQSFDGANGSFTSRIYELYVCILNDDAKQLVDPNDAVWPFNHKYIGSLCPVAQAAQRLLYDENGIENPFRLSGILPFLACYVSSTPGRNTLFLGEDRNDVLGSHRMPGQKKWAIEPLSIDPELPDDRYGNRHITFRHRDSRIVDMDCFYKKHASTITFLRGTVDEKIIESDPGGAQMTEIMRESAEREMQAHGPEGENLEVSVPPLRDVDRIAAAARIRDQGRHSRHL